MKSLFRRLASSGGSSSSGFFSSAMAIDLGTASTIIYQLDRGIVLEEPSVIAIERDTDNVI
ncbi:MAG TPA: rod shape-determining protein, partial [Candidatus Sabulitectum sp.]|nr:rod shape-determining protein [Candidatus Sabulitectum sp.]